MFIMKFQENVWKLMKQIPKGKVTTYGQIAKKLGTKAYRAVGSVCKRNPYAPVVPCHRVVKSNGEVGNYSGSGGIKKKISLLKKEGITVRNNKIVDFDKKLFEF